MANRARNIDLHFRVTAEEKEKIRGRMEDAGISNLSDFMLKMALGGYVLSLDLSDVREMARLLSIATNNMNQIAKRANAARSIHAADVEDLRTRYEGLWSQANGILAKLARL